MQYQYFISFIMNGGIANAEISRTEKIRSLEDIGNIQEMIKKEKNAIGDVRVIYFVLFED